MCNFCNLKYVSSTKIILPILFILCTATIAERALQSLRIEQLHLQEQLGLIQEAIRVETERNKQLIAQSRSQSDPQWIELVLIRELGLVPEGHKKVHFTQK